MMKRFGNIGMVNFERSQSMQENPVNTGGRLGLREEMTNKVVECLTDEWMKVVDIWKEFRKKHPLSTINHGTVGRWLNIAHQFRKCECDMKQFGNRVDTMKPVYRRNQNGTNC